MIIYQEFKTDKNGERRVEVTVEEVDTFRGKRYIQFFLKRKGTEELRSEIVFRDRESSVRKIINDFDEAVVELWPELVLDFPFPK